MPFTVKCPICNLEGTARANEMLTHLLALSRLAAGDGASRAPPPGNDQLPTGFAPPPANLHATTGTSFTTVSPVENGFEYATTIGAQAGSGASCIVTGSKARISTGTHTSIGAGNSGGGARNPMSPPAKAKDPGQFNLVLGIVGGFEWVRCWDVD